MGINKQDMWDSYSQLDICYLNQSHRDIKTITFIFINLFIWFIISYDL